MTPNEERSLYKNDYAGWCKYAAPRWLDLILAGLESAQLAMWRTASVGLRTEIATVALARAAELDHAGKAAMWQKLARPIQEHIKKVKERK